MNGIIENDGTTKMYQVLEFRFILHDSEERIIKDGYLSASNMRHMLEDLEQNAVHGLYWHLDICPVTYVKEVTDNA